jgi:ABC-type polysaccharide/polyol phosphate export permease
MIQGVARRVSLYPSSTLYWSGKTMIELARELWKNRQLISALGLKELRVRYKRSALGFLWSLLNPLLMMVILTVVFSTIARLPIRQYAVFLMSALLPWTFFSQALSYGVESIVGNGELLKKVYIDKAVFPAAAVFSNVINFMLSLVPLVLLLLVMRFPLHWTWIYLPVAITTLILFASGFCFFFAAANVFFRDVSHILQIVLSAWFYISPIIYSLDFIPPKMRLIFRLNPIAYILDGFRDAIYFGHLPSPRSMFAAIVISLAALIAGYAFFRRSQESFVFYV